MGIADELKKLHELHASGAISDEEWALLKKRTLDQPQALASESVINIGTSPSTPPRPDTETHSPLIHTLPEARPALEPVITETTPELPKQPSNSSSLATFYWFIAGAFVLTSLGVLPASITAKLPIIGRFYKSTCFECNGNGKIESNCSSCQGRGYLGGVKCSVCNGKGKVEHTCKFCAGSGKKPKS